MLRIQLDIRTGELTQSKEQLVSLSGKLADCEIARKNLQAQVKALGKKIEKFENPALEDEAYRILDGLKYCSGVDFTLATEMGLDPAVYRYHIEVLKKGGFVDYEKDEPEFVQITPEGRFLLRRREKESAID